MAKHVDYYLSLNSPWAYLASRRFEAIARKHGAEVTIWPVDFGSVFGDIFDEMFGGARGRGPGGRADTRGQDLRFNLEITLEQAYSGTDATVRVPSSVSCETCHEAPPQHRMNPRAALPGKPETRAFCGQCHGTPDTGVPQVNIDAQVL